jgi:hypothetical protein
MDLKKILDRGPDSDDEDERGAEHPRRGAIDISPLFVLAKGDVHLTTRSFPS